ncbi:MAG: hypothetical protein DLM54_02885, partial [Acidimicrobiales bacterium]
PRMLPAAHVSDVVADANVIGAWHATSLASHANQLAAMPSLHMAWAAWCALVLWRVLRHGDNRSTAWAAWSYPLLTAVVVMATGNHFLLDLVAGLATLALATWVSDTAYRWWARWPGVSGFRAIPA